MLNSLKDIRKEKSKQWSKSKDLIEPISSSNCVRINCLTTFCLSFFILKTMLVERKGDHIGATEYQCLAQSRNSNKVVEMQS
jgi:hypothetical protein